ncbi:Hypothetical protein FKW44_011010 [Caligus rogercresseyi]|uniref:Uncharacterized protein n=1 Tax=Caligus rogercresseyi TaxID=217165 RepID=A0A7T8HHY4_CALRO|nr:Hypothetical protein FKW44_011010 [Caligus rogercresseyi]
MLRLCPNLRVLRTGRNACLPSLFHLDQANVKKYCTTQMYTTRAMQTNQLTPNVLLLVHRRT